MFENICMGKFGYVPFDAMHDTEEFAVFTGVGVSVESVVLELPQRKMIVNDGVGKGTTELKEKESSHFTSIFGELLRNPLEFWLQQP